MNHQKTEERQVSYLPEILVLQQRNRHPIIRLAKRTFGDWLTLQKISMVSKEPGLSLCMTMGLIPPLRFQTCHSNSRGSWGKPFTTSTLAAKAEENVSKCWLLEQHRIPGLQRLNIIVITIIIFFRSKAMWSLLLLLSLYWECLLVRNCATRQQSYVHSPSQKRLKHNSTYWK